MHKLVLFSLLSVLVTLACGPRSDEKEAASDITRPLNDTFNRAAQRYGIPARYLMAVALIESGLNTEPSSVVYGDSSNLVGISATETAFGLSYKRMRLSSTSPDSKKLSTQVDAYAQLVKEQLSERGLRLSPNPTTIEDKIEWLWQLAELHHNQGVYRRNLQAIFTSELIETLNSGDQFQDPETNEILRLQPESPQMRYSDFPDGIKDLLTLGTSDSVDGANNVAYLNLHNRDISSSDNKGERVIVIHCPLSLASCLAMQGPQLLKEPVRMMAHYVIPQRYNQIVKFPFQVARHREELLLTNNTGTPGFADNAIVVMLVGRSGRYTAGKRLAADPIWYNRDQLTRMGTLINSLCRIGNIDIGERACQEPSLNGKIVFNHQRSSPLYQWGDVADYNIDIFWPYITSPIGQQGRLDELSFNSRLNIYNAGQPVVVTARFSREATFVLMQVAKRCNSATGRSRDRIIWSNALSAPVDNETRHDFNYTFRDTGPNATGENFIRVLAYNNQSQLLGWRAARLFVNNTRTSNGTPPRPEECSQYEF